ncbi:unnamed protein product [Oppiella nova]|uniref:Caspase family p20 domain-containing protein n=1 Tax=Oppiella nova TaxID=334625 RepID=A0A7R9M547_9ACAR|nr:unnamed protein product [Oppiella nova]CAG2170964.1 unnamed protein product [Oppiella nova]
MLGLAKILDDSGQHEAAEKLRGYNTPKKITEFLTKIELPIQKASAMRSGQSRWFPMDGIPRGKALIFVSIVELLPEANRFASIFGQLYFDKAYPDNALIVMYIGHGCDERIWISNEEQKRICEITFEALEELGQRPEIRQFMKIDRESRKYVIFTEYTNQPENCDHLAKILDESGETEQANKLREYNTPKHIIGLSLNVEITVKKALNLKYPGSRLFPMVSIPRGKAVIFLSIPGFLNEANRFASVFKQLYFDVVVYFISSCEPMVTNLQALAQLPYEGDALIVMYIGHGADEKIWINNGDEVKIFKIVDLFAKGKCHSTFEKVPKIFVLNCCRNSQLSGPNNYNAGFSPFGLAFSQCIAHYACDLTILQIFNKTQDELERLDRLELRPEMRLHMVNRELYFNPGQPENKDDQIPDVQHIRL